MSQNLCNKISTGAMYPTSMRINEEGRLVVNFKTEARFRGQFVMAHPGNVFLSPTKRNIDCEAS